MKAGRRAAARSSGLAARTVAAIDDSKRDTTQEIFQRRSLLPQHSCIIFQMPSVRPRPKLPRGRLGLAPDTTDRTTVSSR